MKWLAKVLSAVSPTKPVFEYVINFQRSDFLIFERPVNFLDPTDCSVQRAVERVVYPQGARRILAGIEHVYFTMNGRSLTYAVKNVFLNNTQIAERNFSYTSYRVIQRTYETNEVHSAYLILQLTSNEEETIKTYTSSHPQ
jgi:hypothetical protein